jgi:hypothetical protein
MWMWWLPFSLVPWLIATHRHWAFPLASVKPMASTKSFAMSPHCWSVRAPSSARRLREQCHTSACLCPFGTRSFLTGSQRKSFCSTSTPKALRGWSKCFAIATASSLSRTPSSYHAMIAASPATRCGSVCAFFVLSVSVEARYSMSPDIREPRVMFGIIAYINPSIVRSIRIATSRTYASAALAS